MNKLSSFVTLAAFGATLVGCSQSPVVLTPQQPSGPGGSTVQYVQIERLSRPAIKEVFESFQHHQISNGVEPYNDPTIKGDIKTTEDALRPPTTYNGAASDYGAGLQGVLYPDEYAVNLNGSTPSGADPYYFLSYELTNGAAFGGRAPNDDVIALELGALFGGTLAAVKVLPEDNQENTCLSTENIASANEDSSKKTGSAFPYLPTPH